VAAIETEHRYDPVKPRDFKSVTIEFSR